MGEVVSEGEVVGGVESDGLVGPAVGGSGVGVVTGGEPCRMGSITSVDSE